MPRSKKPTAENTTPASAPEPAARPKRLAEIHPVLRDAVREVRGATEHLKGRETSVEGMIALLDMLVRTLIQRKLTVSAFWPEVTARHVEQSISVRVVERTRRAHKSRPSSFMPAIMDRDQVRRSDGLYYYKAGRKAGQPVYVFESSGVLSMVTASDVPWGPHLTVQAVRWEPRLGETYQELAARVADDVPVIFDCAARHRERMVERDRLDAERAARIEEVRAVERQTKARLEEQDALVNKLMARATQARELRQYLAEAPTPRDGQDGYGRMLASVAARLAALERDLDPDAIEAAIRAKGHFPLPSNVLHSVMEGKMIENPHPGAPQDDDPVAQTYAEANAEGIKTLKLTRERAKATSSSLARTLNELQTGERPPIAGMSLEENERALIGAIGLLEDALGESAAPTATKPEVVEFDAENLRQFLAEITKKG